MSGIAPASLYATALLVELVQQGVRDVVMCPGSRSQALALAAAEAERAGAIRLHVRVDERSAAYFALGIARETGAPAPVIVTSGTGVVNLLPAIYEADAARVPFIALTADRPDELRGIRSNQTTRQARIFDSIARFCADVDVDAALGSGVDRDDRVPPGRLARDAMRAARGRIGGAPAGPVQLNLAFREPLSGWEADARADFGAGPMTAAEIFARAAEHAADAEASVRAAAGGPDPLLADDGWQHRLEWAPEEVYEHDGDALAVVIAGAGAGAEAEAFAHAAGLPLLAEAVSGSRYGREAITAYATLIDAPDIGGLIERAIVFGHPTLVRQIPALIARDDVETVVVDPYTGDGVDHYDPQRGARVVRAARVAETYDPRSMRRWLGAWVTEDRALRAARSTVHEPDLEAAKAVGYKERSAYARAETAALREPITRELLVESVWGASWPHDRLVIAASRLVRSLDALAPPRPLSVHANRGLAGIDGTVATALGIAVASQSHPDPTHAAGVTRVILGDLALLHDAGSLLLPEIEGRPRVQLFVGNDGGGTIFETLEAAGTAPADAFERTMLTPQHADLRSLATAYGWEYRRVANRGELARLLTEPAEGTMLIEAPLARSVPARSV